MRSRSSGWLGIALLSIASIAAGCSGATANLGDSDAGDVDAGTPIDSGHDSGRKIDGGHPSDGGGANDASTTQDGGGQRDGGSLVDSGWFLDSGQPVDAGRDSSTWFDSGGTCAPADVSGFVPPAYKAARRQVGMCTSAQISNFFTDCLSATSNQQTCAPFGSTGTAADQACAKCIVTPDSAASYGPLVESAGKVSVNSAGCIELKDPNGLACARAYQASEKCDDAACAANCPVTDDASFQLYEACVQQAAANGCSTYTTAARCADAEADGGAAAMCFQGQTFQDLYAVVTPIFCGP